MGGPPVTSNAGARSAIGAQASPRLMVQFQPRSWAHLIITIAIDSAGT